MPTEPIPRDPTLRKILVVDDEPAILTTLRELLTLKSFLVTATHDPQKAMEIMQQETFAVVMTDYDMPGMTGLALLAKMRELYPATTRVPVTGKIRIRDMAEAAEAGIIYRCIPKPYLVEDLVLALRNAVERYQLMTEISELRARILVSSLTPQKICGSCQETAAGPTDAESPEISNTEALADESGPMISDVEMTPEQAELATQGLVKMLYTFHPNLGNTALRAVALCRTIAELLELPSVESNDFLWAAALHDISLVGNDRGIVRRWLRNPQKCTEEELASLKTHPERSAEMLQYSPVFQGAGKIIRSHHENVDGTGYPSGLKEEMIPWLTRILAVVIHYCNCHSASPQRMKEIEPLGGTVFDPTAIEIVARAVPLTRMPLGEREILLIELKPGMVLARDILNAIGLLLLPKGRELTEATINKVWSIDGNTPLDQQVLVYA